MVTKGDVLMEIAAGKFKAQCLRLMDEVRDEHRTFEITKRGRPVARLVPIEGTPPALFGRLSGRVVIHGDITSPLGDAWDVED